MNPLFLASTPLEKPGSGRGGIFDFSSPEGLFVFGSVALVVAAVVVWAIFYYRGKRNASGRHHHRHHRHRHGHHHHHHESREAAEGDESEVANVEVSRDGGSGKPGDTEEAEEHHHSRRRRRRRRREHRPRNPTLAETGGLPPIRTEAPPGP